MILSKHLFWDVDPESIDLTKNARFVIQRVIQRGSINNWLEIKELYGLDFIADEILSIRYLDTRTLNFFSIYLGINKNQFRCYSIHQSTIPHWSS